MNLLTAQEKGEQAYLMFQEKRLDKQEIPFFDRLPRMSLKTQNVANKEIVLKSDHRLFGHMLLVSSSRKLNMKDILQHPLGPLP